MFIALSTCKNFQSKLYYSLSANVFLTRNAGNRKASSRAPEAIFIEHSLEVPVVVVKEEAQVDIIGPPDPVSNLRPVIRKRLLNESSLQQKLREMQDATQAWNHSFWANHNTKFIKERQVYINSRQIEGEETKQLTADEMSEFYKRFLDDNWETHVQYNFDWYKKNTTLLLYALAVSLERCIPKLT